MISPYAPPSAGGSRRAVPGLNHPAGGPARTSLEALSRLRLSYTKSSVVQVDVVEFFSLKVEFTAESSAVLI